MNRPPRGRFIYSTRPALRSAGLGLRNPRELGGAFGDPLLVCDQTPQARPSRSRSACLARSFQRGEPLCDLGLADLGAASECHEAQTFLRLSQQALDLTWLQFPAPGLRRRLSRSALRHFRGRGPSGARPCRFGPRRRSRSWSRTRRRNRSRSRAGLDAETEAEAGAETEAGAEVGTEAEAGAAAGVGTETEAAGRRGVAVRDRRPLPAARVLVAGFDSAGRERWISVRASRAASRDAICCLSSASRPSIASVISCRFDMAMILERV